IETGVRVDRLEPAGEAGDGYTVVAGDRRLRAPNVVVATGAYHEPRIPDFAAELDPDIAQFHSSEFQRVAQIEPGPVLVVGASNSGAEIARIAAAEHETWLSGRDVGQMPFDLEGRVVRWVDLAFWPFLHHVVTV